MCMSYITINLFGLVYVRMCCGLCNTAVNVCVCVCVCVVACLCACYVCVCLCVCVCICAYVFVFVYGILYCDVLCCAMI